MQRTTILSFIILFNNLVFSQNDYQKCMTTKIVFQEDQDNPIYKLNRENINAQNKEWLQNNIISKEVINIPTVVHVIHRSTHQTVGTGSNISNNQIEDAIRILNEDYSKTNSEFPNPPRYTFVNNAGNPNIKFCLATTDPNGNSTNGITRTAMPVGQTGFEYDTQSNDMKQNSTGGINAWNPSKYLNIWICKIITPGNYKILGYAYLPGLPPWQAWKDGLVVDLQAFGTTGVSTSSDGRTATHEIGHYLGLSHTFCEDGYGSCCDNDEYNVNDTPAAYYANTDGPYFGSVNSNTNNNTCNDLNYQNIFNTNVVDMDENYMSYAEDTWMFTAGQVNVMNSTLNNYRSSLKNSNVSVDCSGSIGVGIYENIISSNIEIYPNPTSGIVVINTPHSIENIHIYDLLGKEKIKNIAPIDNSINLSELPEGVYFIMIETNKNTSIQKVVITK